MMVTGHEKTVGIQARGNRYPRCLIHSVAGADGMHIPLFLQITGIAGEMVVRSP